MVNRAYYFDVSTISHNAYLKLAELDRSFIGTPDYMGICYFWAYEYRHYLRDCTIPSRRKVHKKFLEHGLAVDGESPKHLEIVKLYAKGYQR